MTDSVVVSQPEYHPDLAAERPSGLCLHGVAKELGSVAAVDGIDLAIGEGEFFTLLGPSGSGKTTTLNLVAGFLRPDRGEITIRGRSVAGVPPERREVGIVFQSYALFPHLSVLENVAFPLRRRSIGKRQAKARAMEALELVALGDRANSRPTALSGGQQQRAALARALVFEPNLVLLDEPLGALDRRLRQRLQMQLRTLHQRLGFTALYITHDQEEALTLSDRIGIMRAGKIEQMGTGEECYRRPVTMFVARFLGDANVLPAAFHTLVAGGRCRVGPVNGRPTYWPLDGELETWIPPGCEHESGQEMGVIGRPEALCIREPGRATDQPIYVHGRLRERVFLGQDVLATVDSIGAGEVSVRERLGDNGLECQVGDEVDVCWRDVDSAVAVPLEETHDG